MRRALKLVTLLAVVAMAALPLAVAGAHTGVVAFTGTATLGAPISFPVCTSGTGSPHVCDPPTTTWSLVAPMPAPANDRCIDLGTGGAGTTCSLNTDGTLTAAFNSVNGNTTLGPWCGASGGTTSGGTSLDRFTDSAGGAHTVDAKWITSAGTILPLTGTYSGHNSGQTVILTRSAAGPPITTDAVKSLTETTVQCLAGTAQVFGVVGLSINS